MFSDLVISLNICVWTGVRGSFWSCCCAVLDADVDVMAAVLEGCSTSVGCCVFCETNRWTSSLVTLPSRPVPVTSEMLTSSSLVKCLTAGVDNEPKSPFPFPLRPFGAVCVCVSCSPASAF